MSIKCCVNDENNLNLKIIAYNLVHQDINRQWKQLMMTAKIIM